MACRAIRARSRRASPPATGARGPIMPEDHAASSQPGRPSRLSTGVAIEIVGLNKWFGDFHVLRDINLKVMSGERIVICGPSGSGKSTMIRCINRLEEHQSGRIVV